MPFTLFQAASSLQTMNTAGVLTTLTLPTGVLIDSTKPLRTAIFGRYIVCVNSPNRPITVDPEGTVRVLCPRPPRTMPTLSGAAGGALSGTFKVAQSFLVLDVDGNLIAESAMGPTSAAATITSQYLQAASLDLATDTVSSTRCYRTVTNGSVMFPWVDVDGNKQTSIVDDLSDAGLQLFAAPSTGTPPSTLTQIATFRSRGWGVSLTDIDTLRFTDANKIYAWPTTYGLTIGRPGSDDRGITGIVPRRDFLGCARHDTLFQVTGTTPTDFRPVVLKENVGIEGTDTVVIFRDTAYWLAMDGVYTWSDEGIRCISDAKVRSWFTTDTYFNRGQFQNAVARISPTTKKYQLLLASAGQTTLNRWVEYDIEDETWWGPHQTGALTPSWAGVIQDANSLLIPVFCSTNGFFWQDQATRTDDTATGITIDVDTKFHDGNTPDIEKKWLQLSLISKVQTAGTLTITPKVGGLDAAVGTAISADMTKGREKLRRLGRGRFLQLNFAHSTAGQDIELYGYEIPFFEIGRR